MEWRKCRCITSMVIFKTKMSSNMVCVCVVCKMFFEFDLSQVYFKCSRLHCKWILFVRSRQQNAFTAHVCAEKLHFKNKHIFPS